MQTPLTKEKAKTFAAGDYVYITGTIYSARDAAHKRLTEALEIAKEATSLFESQTRSHEHRTIDLKNIQYLCLDVKSRNQDNDQSHNRHR